MTIVRCLKCGRANESGNTVCVGCGAQLFQDKEYEERCQELKDYNNYRKRYSLMGILIGIVTLLLFYPVIDWLFRNLLTEDVLGSLAPVSLDYLTPGIMLFVFLAAVLPMMVGRWRIVRKYNWSREKLHTLETESKALPREFFEGADPGTTKAKVPARKVQGPSVLVLVIIFALVGLMAINKYTEFKPLDPIISTIGIGSAKTVNGRYECHYGAKDMGGGVTRVAQTWAYVFRTDGTYTTFLSGYQQYSGSWSQAGTTLSINVPAIKGISAAYTAKVRVSRDGSYFTTSDGSKYIKVK